MCVFRQITEITKMVTKSRVVLQLEIAWGDMTKYSHQEKNYWTEKLTIPIAVWQRGHFPS